MSWIAAFLNGLVQMLAHRSNQFPSQNAYPFAAFIALQKTLVIGSGGVGKSTFATRLEERTGLLLLHLDVLHWRAGWIEPAKEEWMARVKPLVTTERRIINGNLAAHWNADSPPATP